MAEENQERFLRENWIRTMRDRVFSQNTTDNNWGHCKENWMKPENVRWLEEKWAVDKGTNA